jgi:uncharacterized repeat protein (TIGR03803 family)
VFTLLYEFDFIHGCAPQAPLIQGTNGNFYGTTIQGGASNAGVVFRITPAGTLTVLYNFDGTHGEGPVGPLVEGSDGNFYGTTSGGGSGGSSGVVFKVTPTGTLTVLHELNGRTDGLDPSAGLVQATDGNFYGASQYGGNSTNCSLGCGTLFQITPSGAYSVLYNFDGVTGDQPQVTLIQHTNGLLYGDTNGGGTGQLCSNGRFFGCGVFYSWNGNLPPFVTLLPYLGKVGSTIEFLGQGFTSASTVSFNGTPAVVAQGNTGTYLRAQVPSGATTGFVTVTTSSGTLTSNKQFVVTP